MAFLVLNSLEQAFCSPANLDGGTCSEMPETGSAMIQKVTPARSLSPALEDATTKPHVAPHDNEASREKVAALLAVQQKRNTWWPFPQDSVHAGLQRVATSWTQVGPKLAQALYTMPHLNSEGDRKTEPQDKNIEEAPRSGMATMSLHQGDSYVKHLHDHEDDRYMANQRSEEGDTYMANQQSNEPDSIYIANQPSDKSESYVDNWHGDAQPRPQLSQLSPPFSDREILSDYPPPTHHLYQVDPKPDLKNELPMKIAEASMMRKLEPKQENIIDQPDSEVDPMPMKIAQAPIMKQSEQRHEKLIDPPGVKVDPKPESQQSRKELRKFTPQSQNVIAPLDSLRRVQILPVLNPDPEPPETDVDPDPGKSSAVADPVPEMKKELRADLSQPKIEKEASGKLEADVDPEPDRSEPEAAVDPEREVKNELRKDLPPPKVEKQSMKSQHVGSDGSVAKPTGGSTTGSVCFNWFGMNLDATKIPTAKYDGLLGQPWGEMNNNVCNSGLTAPYGAYSCWTRSVTGSLKPCGHNVNCVAGVCVKEQNLQNTWSKGVANRRCNGKELDVLTGDAQDHTILDCKILCESISTCTGFNEDKRKCSLFTSFTSENGCDDHPENNVHFVMRAGL